MPELSAHPQVWNYKVVNRETNFELWILKQQTTWKPMCQTPKDN